MISNWTRAARSFNFEITRMISAQIALHSVQLPLWIAPFFALNCIFFPASEEAALKTKQPITFQGFFKVTNQTVRKWKTESIMWQILQLLFPKLKFPPPPTCPKWMNLISNLFSTVSIKYLNWLSPVIGWFLSGCNIVVIEPCVMQFWLEIILVISNQALQLPLYM